MQILANLDLNKNELQNVVLQNLAGAPEQPRKGQMYYNTTDNLAYQYNGSEWEPLGRTVATSSSVGGVIPDDGFKLDKEGHLSRNIQYFSTVRKKGATDQDAIKVAVGGKVPNDGDVCIIITPIAKDKNSYTAFVYDEMWKAMDGNINAQNVFLSRDITITAPIGVHTIPSVGYKVLDSAGSNIEDFLESLASEEKNPKTIQPSVTIKDFDAKGYEVGTIVTPKYTATLNPGSYTYGPATGVKANSWTVKNSDNATKNSSSGTFDAITITDTTSYKVTATCAHSIGAMPVTNRKNNYPKGRIIAGNKSKTTAPITGFRSYFYGSKTSKTEKIDSSFIRTLTNSDKAIVASSFDMTIQEGAFRVVIAIPQSSGKVVSKVEDKNAFGTDVVTSFVKQTVQVNGKNNFTAVPYDVYVFDSGKALAANTYTVTIA